MTDNSKNGIIYCRVSSVEQVDGTSLESQERVCREYAKREGINILNVYIEKGESAKTAERTEFMKAIAFCSTKKNNVSFFIVYKLDRFSRNQADHVAIRQSLKQYNTELRSVTEPINETPMGKMMEGILSTFAEFDNNVRTERSVNGMRERLKQGIWVWQAPLGYCRLLKGANLSPDPVLAKYIQLAFTEYAKGTYTYESLSNFLNSRGFVSRQGNNMSLTVLEKILKNPIYCGIIKVWDMEYQGKFEPLISEELFYQCQGRKQKGRRVPHLKNNNNFPLRKFVVCESCNQSITGSTSTGCSGNKYSYYHHHKQNCSNAKSIPKEHFEQMFVEYLDEINPSLEYEEVFKNIMLDIWKSNYKTFDQNNEQLRKEINTLENQRQRVFELHQKGIYSDSEFVDQKNNINSKIRDKEKLIHDKRADELNMDESLEYCFSFIRVTSKTWLNLKDKPEKRLQFQKLIFEDNLYFSGDKFGTPKLTPIYSLYQQYLVDPSSLVTLQRIEL